MKSIQLLLIIICLLLAIGIGFYAGTQTKPRFEAVKTQGPGTETEVVLVFDTQTGKLAGKYQHYGEYQPEASRP